MLSLPLALTMGEPSGIGPDITLSRVSWRKLLRNIFRRCPNAAAVTFSKSRTAHGATASANGSTWTTEETTVGEGVKTDAGTLNRIRDRVLHPARTARRP